SVALRRATSTPRSAANRLPATANQAPANSSNESAPASRPQSRSPTRFGASADLELTELRLILLQALFEHEHQALGGVGIEHNPVGEQHAHFLLVRAPGLVRAEQQRHFLARAEYVADIGVGRIHFRIVPDDLG